jgi:hypothetical protein
MGHLAELALQSRLEQFVGADIAEHRDDHRQAALGDRVEWHQRDPCAPSRIGVRHADLEGLGIAAAVVAGEQRLDVRGVGGVTAGVDVGA